MEEAPKTTRATLPAQLAKLGDRLKIIEEKVELLQTKMDNVFKDKSPESVPDDLSKEEVDELLNSRKEIMELLDEVKKTDLDEPEQTPPPDLKKKILERESFNGPLSPPRTNAYPVGKTVLGPSYVNGVHVKDIYK